MNPAQLQKYGICGKQAVDAMRKLAHTGTDRDLRHKCIRLALGRDKEPGRFNNREFDAVLRVFAGYSAMGDLAEQLRLLEQPKLRMMTAAAPYLDEIGVEHDRREQYVRTIYERVQARRPKREERVYSLEEIPDEDLPLVLGALHHTAMHKHGIEHNHPHSGRGRASYDHRVGSRKFREPADAGLPGMQDARDNVHNRIEAPADTDPF